MLFLDAGVIADRGTHEQLIESCPGYRELITAYARAADNGEPDTAAVDSEGAFA